MVTKVKSLYNVYLYVDCTDGRGWVVNGYQG